MNRERELKRPAIVLNQNRTQDIVVTVYGVHLNHKATMAPLCISFRKKLLWCQVLLRTKGLVVLVRKEG